MGGESFEVEEWDADFLDQLVQAEELALSTQRPHHPPPPLPPPCDVSYSPPRELSQRTHEPYHTGGIPDSIGSFGTGGTHTAKEQENDRLKKELNHVSKQLHGVSKHLHHLEEEVLELRKERDKKEEQLKVLHSRIEAKDADQHTKNAEMECPVSSPTAPGISTVCQNANNQLGSLKIRSSENLFRLWNSDEQKQGRVLVAKLFMTCEVDFHLLFGYMNSPQKDFNKGAQSMETAKVSHLYSVLTKISNDSLRLGDLLGALADLCSLKNVSSQANTSLLAFGIIPYVLRKEIIFLKLEIFHVEILESKPIFHVVVIVRSSIRILHKVLSDSLSMEKEFGKRENVIVEEHFSENVKSDTNGSGDSENESLCFANVAEMLKRGQILSGLKLSSVKNPGYNGFFNHSIGTSISGVFWVELFETVCLIAIENNEAQIRREALSIMNLILMRQNAYSEREKFAGELVFQSLPQLLRREAGFSVQDQAVHTLYLLCNCPKVIPMLCSGFEEDGERACSKDIDDKNTSTFHGFNEILIGLAECVACYGSASAAEMRLRRNAISLLAFMGSAGKSGFQILLYHKLSKGTNFLAIILLSLASDLDLQALTSAKKSGIVKEQCLLIREALIFLNRLVSHPDYSVPVLQALTNTRDMASTTVDIANRLTQNSNLLWKDNSSKKHIRESEIMDLARVFKKRVFTFLGDSIS
ncbi:hypothetical protein DH2020_005745 [Rehmannia glutinosa]|uniref:Uncharacterized protein n=1 Tax=Rehmannia glutinosa TaxID=99300 RepID=A0ABR0XHK4_REHGL